MSSQVRPWIIKTNTFSDYFETKEWDPCDNLESYLSNHTQLQTSSSRKCLGHGKNSNRRWWWAFPNLEIAQIAKLYILQQNRNNAMDLFLLEYNESMNDLV